MPMFLLVLCVIPLVITLVFTVIILNDYWRESGIETVHLKLPQWETVLLKKEIVEFFSRKGARCEASGNRLFCHRGKSWGMGVRTFNIFLFPEGYGSSLTGYFYLRSLFPRYMKLTNRGWLYLIPRRKGWRMKNELFTYLGVDSSGIEYGPDPRFDPNWRQRPYGPDTWQRKY